jgi:hypothetical protein
VPAVARRPVLAAKFFRLTVLLTHPVVVDDYISELEEYSNS